ncbi:MAG: hypothetical protein ACRDJP_02735 [Actinomycetota bacterium]
MVTLVAVGALAAGTLATSATGAAKSATKKFVKRKFNVALQMATQTAARVGYDAVEDEQMPDTSGGFVALATASVTAPTPGFLVLHGTSDTYNFFGPEVVLCDLAVNGAQVPSSLHFAELDFGSFQEDDTAGDGEAPMYVNGEEDCATHAVVPVGAGTHTVAYRTVNEFSDTSYDASVVSAVYVPFGGTGAPPRLTAPDPAHEVTYEEALAERGMQPPVRP